MSDKFQDKYRIPSTRLHHWDYGWDAPYFITICTQNRECYFGDVVNGQMQLNGIGEIVKNEWLKTFDMRPDMNLQMDAWVIMPNHFHAIIVIGKNIYNKRTGGDDKMGGGGDEMGGGGAMHCRDAMHCVSTVTTTTTSTSSTNPTTGGDTKNKFGPQSKNLASIIRGFKSGVTKRSRKINAGFAWQPRFYDHIIRNDVSFQKIRNYIYANPSKWQGDQFHPLRLPD